MASSREVIYNMGLPHSYAVQIVITVRSHFFVCLFPPLPARPHHLLFLFLLAPEFFFSKEKPLDVVQVGFIQLCRPFAASCRKSNHMTQGWPIRYTMLLALAIV